MKTLHDNHNGTLDGTTQQKKNEQSDFSLRKFESMYLERTRKPRRSKNESEKKREKASPSKEDSRKLWENSIINSHTAK